MFASALKSFSSNIERHYSLSKEPAAFSGPWKIYDAKKRSTGQMVSVFVFEKKSLDNSSSGALSLRSTSTSGLKQAQDEAYDRLKKAASSLARLRHPCILELVEQVEETRAGLMFATEHVTGSLGGYLREKDEQERSAGSRYVVEDGRGGRRRREVEIDELEIQKGILQIAKGLEFLHESAQLIHGNLTPEAVFINAKSDWKISGLLFAVPYNASEGSASVPASWVGDMLNHDPRLPSSVQLNLDYAAPEFVMDSEASPSMDLFSLGLLIISLYTHPHSSPIQTHNSVSTYRRLLSSPSTVPNASNQFLSTRPLPKGLAETLLPRLLTRRPANRLTAREFQESPYFDNMMVSTIRFLDNFPAKTPGEKSSFLRGLVKVLSQFPRSVLEKKMLPMLVEELKDKEMLPLILPNIFGIVERTSGRTFSEKVLPRLKTIFFPHGQQTAEQKTKSLPGTEKDQNLQSGLSVILDNMQLVIDNTSAREFKEDILPLIHLALESANHSLQDKSLRSLSIFLPALDFPTLKNELFPVISTVFSKTTSLGIKIRGLEAFCVVLGGEVEGGSDGLDGMSGDGSAKKKGTGPTLDKYTVQEKMVPLLRGIKTREPAVMMAALEVFKHVGTVCDREIVASDVLPILWSMSLGPLLNLQQFQMFMSVIKGLSHRIEEEQTRKLQELATPTANGPADFMSFGGASNGATPGNEEVDFERLVLGNKDRAATPFDGGWGAPAIAGASKPMRSASPAMQKSKPVIDTTPAPKFSWSTPSSQTTAPSTQPVGPTISSFAPLAPASTNKTAPAPVTGFGSTTSFRNATQPTQSTTTSSSNIDWTAAARKSTLSTNSAVLQPQTRPQPATTSSSSSWSIPPPPSANTASNAHPTILNGQVRMTNPPVQTQNWGAFSIPPPPSASASSSRTASGTNTMTLNSLSMGGTSGGQQSSTPNYNLNIPMGAYTGGVLAPQNVGSQQQQQQQQQQQNKQSSMSAWDSLL